jgi:hypothetical protein
MKSLYRRFIRWLNEPVFPEPWKRYDPISKTDHLFICGDCAVYIANYADHFEAWLKHKDGRKWTTDHHIILTPIQERDMP